MGPLAYADAAVDGFACAHQDKLLLLPMVSLGPIGICIFQWAQTNLMAAEAAYFDRPIPSHQQQQLYML